ncbi:MAG: teichoic acid biosynthesis protein [Sandaracinaceae bacterium]|nr:teichoic acid biosynthesis protein [Sandaracinaceae bacterium]
MKILYGVVGEGMGHAIRSRVVLTHLVESGHEVKVVVSGRAHGFLAKHFKDVVEIAGLPLVYKENAVDRDRTAWKIFAEAPSYALENVQAYMRDVRHFEADIVISDFDSFAHVYGIRHNKPVISIDNQHAIPLFQHDDDVLEMRDAAGNLVHDYHNDFDLARRIIRNKMRGCVHYFVTSFFAPQVREKYASRTTVVPPILRPEVLARKATANRGDHLLVYQTSASYVELLDVLKKVGVECRVYGFLRPDSKPPAGTREGDDIRYAPNVLLRAFSEEKFVDDLASSRAVVAGGGFTVLGEAVYLGKPIYSVPIHKHFEQIVSARYLVKLGYGEHHEGVTEGELKAFLAKTDEYAKALEAHHQEGNQKLFAALDTELTLHAGTLA